MGANSHTNYALRKNGQQEITPIHPELAEPLEEILGQTYGLIVYQEQVMAIAQKVAGYSLGKADLLRRAMGKKKKSVLDAEYVGFEAGMKANGFSAAAVKTLWDILVPFADYAFNKAHSAAYGLISYWTAYLKANYPAEYMAGLLTSVQDDKDRRPIYLAECRRMGIKVLPPDVNESSWDFTAVGTDIRFGLASVRNVGHNVVDSIVRAREEKGAFKDFADFMRKIDTVACNKKVIESLAKAGAFDSLGHSRQGIAAVHAQAVDSAMALKRKEAEGQFDLFGSFGDGDGGGRPVRRGAGHRRSRRPTGRSPSGWSSSATCSASTSPTTRCTGSSTCSPRTPTPRSPRSTAGGVEDGANVTIAGILTAVSPRTNKQGAPWAIATLEDLESGIEVLFFPKTWAEVSEKVVRDQIVVVKGRISRRDDQPSLFGSEVTVPELTEGPRGPGAGLDAGRPLHAAGGRAAPRGARQPPRHHRGAAQAGQRQPRDGAAARPGAAGPAEHRADGRHQGAARPDQRGDALNGPRWPPAADGRLTPPVAAAVRRREPAARPPRRTGAGWSEVRVDLRSSVLLLLRARRCVGLPAGVLWWLLAPRRTSGSPRRVRSRSSPSRPTELLVADDGVFALVRCRARAAGRGGRVAGCAAAAGSRPSLALAVGTLTGAALAWQVGELLGAGPTRASWPHVGGVVTTALTLGSLPALALAPFGALLAYVGAAAISRDDGLGRTRPAAGGRARRGNRRRLAAGARPAQFTVIGVAKCRSGTGTAPSVCSRISSRRSSRDSAASRRRVADSASSACRSSVVSSAADGHQPGQRGRVVGHRVQQDGGPASPSGLVTAAPSSATSATYRANRSRTLADEHGQRAAGDRGDDVASSSRTGGPRDRRPAGAGGRPGPRRPRRPPRPSPRRPATRPRPAGRAGRRRRRRRAAGTGRRRR